MPVETAPPGEPRIAPRVDSRIDPKTFWPALVVSLGFVLWGTVAPDSLKVVAKTALDGVIRIFGWSFVVSTAFFLAFSALLACAKFGTIRLGRDDEEPEFSTVSWVCMMFSVGMGIGLMFWGVAEPVSHFGAPPHGLAQPQSKEAALLVMGGLDGLQTAAILAAAPFLLVMAGLCVSLMIGLKDDLRGEIRAPLLARDDSPAAEAAQPAE